MSGGYRKRWVEATKGCLRLQEVGWRLLEVVLGHMGGWVEGWLVVTREWVEIVGDGVEVIGEWVVS